MRRRGAMLAPPPFIAFRDGVSCLVIMPMMRRDIGVLPQHRNY